MSKRKIVIIGAGYGGMLTTVQLQKIIPEGTAEIVLINRNQYHYLTTLLHETAAGTREDEKVCIDIRSLIDPRKVTFIEDNVIDIEKEKQQVILQNGEPISYDYLVIGLGFEPATFGIPGLKEHSLSIRSVKTAREIRLKIEEAFARYAVQPNREHPLTFVVGGGGFTGVEFVAELAERCYDLCEFHKIPYEQVRVICVEAGPGVLPGFPPALVEYAMKSLSSQGVEFRIGTAIKEVTPGRVKLAKGDQMDEVIADVIIWTGGVQGCELIGRCDFDNLRGRIKVEKDLRAPGFNNIFAVGDSALIMDEANGRPYPPTAQFAVQEAFVCAKNILASIQGQPLVPFVPDNKGSVASIGQHDAIGVVFGKQIQGVPAVFMNRMIDNRYLFFLGGLPLVMKKGRIPF
ncbi:NAD(P)/FAD-dependent oxidoreductase [Heliophilum fasciatum]|uniref:NADH dehydrogenase n=1 Tax=Heliophilum fasciatum TaxID=35700 RepID=A0A4R2RQG4_9FIRM|nr:NAD(P)/FAD-dependent oxidoreductase [Heliophilum fasciatum]MCW2277631.1 NADH dehydrogenase [Heliophilum fasciatum]TCP64979.1 NADH dehydrogenase [Heliophilum fasciatum]